MHKLSRRAMARMLGEISLKQANVLDVGSLDVNGTFRPLVETRKGWKYTGLDVIEGTNVDIVSDDPYCYPIPDGYYDVVISGSTMEHVADIWRWIPELVRMLRPGGHLCIITHWRFDEHYRPDYWRIMPDGMRHLFDMAGQLEVYDIRGNISDTIASARKVTA